VEEAEGKMGLGQSRRDPERDLEEAQRFRAALGEFLSALGVAVAIDNEQAGLARVGGGVIGIERDRRVEEVERLLDVLGGEVLVDECASLDEEPLRIRVLGAADNRRRLRCPAEGRTERGRDIFGDVGLDLDRIAGRPVVVLRPAVDPGLADRSRAF